ncbi:DUF2845 domain-containing protein [Klebsiella pneumoniae]
MQHYTANERKFRCHSVAVCETGKSDKAVRHKCGRPFQANHNYQPGDLSSQVQQRKKLKMPLSSSRRDWLQARYVAKNSTLLTSRVIALL